MSSINHIGGPSPLQRVTANPIQKQVGADAPEIDGNLFIDKGFAHL